MLSLILPVHVISAAEAKQVRPKSRPIQHKLLRTLFILVLLISGFPFWFPVQATVYPRVHNRHHPWDSSELKEQWNIVVQIVEFALQIVHSTQSFIEFVSQQTKPFSAIRGLDFCSDSPDFVLEFACLVGCVHGTG